VPSSAYRQSGTCGTLLVARSARQLRRRKQVCDADAEMGLERVDHARRGVYQVSLKSADLGRRQLDGAAEFVKGHLAEQSAET
jgi:hypothetical protein